MSSGLITILILALVVLFVVVFLYLAVAGRQKGVARRLPKPQTLTEAEALLLQGQFQFAIMKAFAAVELCLKQRFGQTPTQTAFDLLNIAEQKGTLDKPLVAKAHQLRMLRNKAIHEQRNVAEGVAKQALLDTRLIVSRLGYLVD